MKKRKGWHRKQHGRATFRRVSAQLKRAYRDAPDVLGFACDEFMSALKADWQKRNAGPRPATEERIHHG